MFVELKRAGGAARELSSVLYSTAIWKTEEEEERGWIVKLREKEPNRKMRRQIVSGHVMNYVSQGGNISDRTITIRTFRRTIDIDKSFSIIPCMYIRLCFFQDPSLTKLTRDS